MTEQPFNPLDPFNQNPEPRVSRPEDAPSVQPTPVPEPPQPTPAPRQPTPAPTQKTTEPNKPLNMFQMLKDASTKLSGEGLMDLIMQGHEDKRDKLMEIGSGLQSTLFESIFGEQLQGAPEELTQMVEFEPLAEIKELLFGETAPTESQTPTSQAIQNQGQLAMSAASRHMNNPSVGNQGVIRDQSRATTPGASPVNYVENMQTSILSPPANRKPIF